MLNSLRHERLCFCLSSTVLLTTGDLTRPVSSGTIYVRYQSQTRAERIGGNKRMKTTTKILAAFGCLFLCMTAAFANTIIQSCIPSIAVTTPVPFTGQTCGADLFNPTLGALSQVTLSLIGSGSVYMSVTNKSETLQYPTLAATIALTMTGPGGTYVGTSYDLTPISGEVSGLGQLVGSPQDLFGSMHTDKIYTNAVFLAAFTGVGAFSFSGDGVFSNINPTTFDSEVLAVGSLGGNLTITFVYDPNIEPAGPTALTVPEPATLLLAGGALLGLGVLRRRRLS